MTWLSTGVGALLVLAALRDIFHTLWHPRGFGTICRTLFGLVWRVTRYAKRKGQPSDLAGPLGIVLTAVAWGSMIVVGWALVYLPHLPDGFSFTTDSVPGTWSEDLVAALYLSLVTVATLGFGDIVPTDPALRVVTPLQALVGFVLLTAAISWMLQVYPALTRRRALARRLSMLAATGATEVVAAGEPGVATRLLDSVTAGITMTELDLTMYGETYYFRESEPDLSLASTLPYVLELTRAGAGAESVEVRQAAAMLERALADLTRRLDRAFLTNGGSIREVLDAFAADHQQRPVTAQR